MTRTVAGVVARKLHAVCRRSSWVQASHGEGATDCFATSVLLLGTGRPVHSDFAAIRESSRLGTGSGMFVLSFVVATVKPSLDRVKAPGEPAAVGGCEA